MPVNLGGFITPVFFNAKIKSSRPALYYNALFASYGCCCKHKVYFQSSGQSVPLLAEQFSKDFFPILMGLIMYLAFFSDYPSVKQEG
ncbi:MAG: hypothetical protein IPG70_08330 [Moraxellaceae bacterium]|nr:hypothetical protein [Moraxellaceae bacterium]